MNINFNELVHISVLIDEVENFYSEKGKVEAKLLLKKLEQFLASPENLGIDDFKIIPIKK